MTFACAGEAQDDFRPSARTSHGNGLFCSILPPESNVSVCRRGTGHYADGVQTARTQVGNTA